MKYVEKNGYKISSMTLGTVQLGLNYGVNNSHGMPSYEESADILNTALELGIKSFDTARSYGESELVLGKFFSTTDKERTLISKTMITGIDKSALKDKLFSDVRESLDRLGIEKLPFLKLHNESMLIEYGDTMIRSLHDLKAEGLVDGVGVSFSDKSRMTELCDGAGFDCVQLPANMLDNDVLIDGSIERLWRDGTVVFVRSLYLQGLFFKDVTTLPEKIKCAEAPLLRLHSLARDAGISMAEMAVTFVRDCKGISSLLLGCDNPSQLRESVSLIDAPALDSSVRDEIIKISKETPPIVIRPWDWNK